ncbi:MAG: hypothetical protein NT067_06465 [Candidatus Diapherotrites archaeon]|nr:hypothetical protein [Candidatus Diapherotrites archaeon]
MYSLLFRGERGQESAPFELLIAVIVMIFVMMFGYRAIEQLQIADCQAKINMELENMRTALEATANQNSLQTIHFEAPQCFKNSNVRVSTVRNRTICSQICQEGRGECISLDFRSDAYTKRVCVNIPISTVFEGTEDGGPGTYCAAKESYALTVFSSANVGAPNGDYILANRTPPGYANPVVCAYRYKQA